MTGGIFAGLMRIVDQAVQFVPTTAQFAAVVQAIAVVVTACFASLGLNAWRRQLVGKRRLEVAEEMLLAAYKAENNLRHVRNPTTWWRCGRRSAW